MRDNIQADGRHETHRTEMQPDDHGRLVIDDRVIPVRGIRHDGPGVMVTCTCCPGDSGTTAVADGPELLVASYGELIKFREPDFELVRDSQTSISELMQR